MHTKPKLLGALALLTLTALRSHAVVVFQDNFPYPNGPLANSTWVPGAGNSLNGDISVGNNAVFIAGTTADQPRAYFTNGLAAFTFPSATSNFLQTTYYFPSNAPVAALYFSYYINVSSAVKSYHAYLTDTNFTLVNRIYACTNTVVSGDYRIGVGTATTISPATNSSGLATNIVQQDLAYGTTHLIVGRYVLATGLETVWVDPANETDTGSAFAAYATFSPPLPNLAGFGLRSNGGTSSPSGAMSVSNLLIATTFEEVLPSSASSNPPFITVQPQDNTSVFEGGTATFTAVAGGDLPLSCQWYYNTNTTMTDNGTTISGSTSNVLTLTNLTVPRSGTYSCIITNQSGTATTRYARLVVSPVPIPPTITNQPAGSTNIVGDTVTFAVVAGGVPAPAYQWKFVSNGVTNNVTATNATGATTATLTITGVLTNQAGQYFVTITNLVGKTNSAVVPLVVNLPPLVNIAQLNAMQDNTTWTPTNTTSLFTVQGIVTTWTNMTTSGNSEFYIQDASGGIAVFWYGAPASTNLPPAGALVQVTAPMASFDGLQELEPVVGTANESVTIISTNNPLPVAQPLPFDPNIVNTPAAMEMLEGSYFVASNIFLDLGTPNFVANANDPVTNILTQTFTDSVHNLTFTNGAGQTFILFVNSHTDIPGQPKPTGPVTVFGVLGQFVATSPFIGGYEFTPSRYADIISYVHWTNVLSNVIRYGDALSNSFTESVLQPGETLTMTVAISDPAGGNTVSLTPVLDDLPSSAQWVSVNNGATATATFVFRPTAADAGSNYVVNLASTTDTATTTNTWGVYVPTSDEQKVRITEVFARPTTNNTSPAFNPLARSLDNNNVLANDQFVEIANVSGTDQNLFHWTIGDASITWQKFFSGTLSSSNSAVIYGGPLNGDPNPPQLTAPTFPASTGSLGLSPNGGVVTLHNNNGYLIDRVVYPASTVAGSLSRFPTLNSELVPQAFISTNFVTAGNQYDGGAWNLATKVPVGVSPVSVTYRNPVALGFTADPSQAYTLWLANHLTDRFQVVNGRQFPTSAGTFLVTNPPPTMQFYFITTQ